MILFKSDWNKYPKAIIDLKTKNRSFIRMAVLLDRMGIKNNKYFLSLLDPAIQGYDPHNLTDNSMELKLRIVREAKLNPFYYTREISRVPVIGAPSIPYKLNRANLALLWCFFNNIDVFITQPRQTGKTISSIDIIKWLLYIGTTNFTMHMITKGTDLVQTNISRLKIMRDSSPPYMISKHTKDTDNKEGISYTALDTRCITKVAQKDPRAARALCIGETVPTQFFDEFAYIYNNKVTYEAALPAVTTASEQAKLAGIPCASILSTTAGDIVDPSGKYAFSVMNDCLKFREIFYDIEDQNQLVNILNNGSANRMMYIVYSYLQLGKSHEWFKENTRKITDPIEIEKDYLNIWQVARKSGPVPKHLLDKISKNEIDPIKSTIFESLVINWYVEPSIMESDEFKNQPFVIGVDTSSNIGIDFTTLYIQDPSSLSTIATCRCNESNLTYIAQLIVKLMLDFPRSILIPERNYNGGMLIDLILIALKGKGIDPWKRIFNTITQDMNLDTNKNVFRSFPEGTIKKYFGFNTTGSETSRKMLYKTVLLAALELNNNRLYDSILINEIKGLTFKNDRVDHSDGGHDDLTIAWLLTCYFVLYGKNLHMYDVRDGEFLSHVDTKGNTVDPLEKQRQIDLRNKIKKLEELMDKALSPLIKKSYEGEIKNLKCYLKDIDLDMDIMSTDQMSNKAIEESKSNNKLSMTNMKKVFTNFF